MKLQLFYYGATLVSSLTSVRVAGWFCKHELFHESGYNRSLSKLDLRLFWSIYVQWHQNTTFNSSMLKITAVTMWGNTYTVLGVQHNCYTTVPGPRVCCWCWALWPALQKTPSQAAVPSFERTDRNEDHHLLPRTAALEHENTTSSQICTPAKLLFFRMLQHCVFVIFDSVYIGNSETMIYIILVLLAIYLNSD